MIQICAVFVFRANFNKNLSFSKTRKPSLTKFENAYIHRQTKNSKDKLENVHERNLEISELMKQILVA